MSKSVASESKGDNETPKQSRKRGDDDEEDENESGISEGLSTENSRTLTTVSAAHAATDQFMHTPEFRRHFVDFVQVDALMALKVATKGWNAAVDALMWRAARLLFTMGGI
ncbi:hypothetical protein TrLO_g4014 [Triparma laevis f. longispina]|uniref:Uncharacterized protein n=1 Tax=Triparma laevis f. longispina TaxID=1714387 RepID=A0A9W7A8X6_9STRA|nr:hypothetical protein TrLO_g4014 [Triparma laevis f. longispina]